jgi:hypothetical protein
MKSQRLILAMGIMALTQVVFSQTGDNCVVQPTTLKAMRDCYRPLLVFAPAVRNSSFAAQQKLLEEYADDMMDRNLLYVPVLEDSANFKDPLDAPYVLLKQSEIQAIRARFQIAPGDFAVVLVGKDGGEKFRTSKPISVLRLDQIVDAMPMGSREKAVRSATPH